MKNFPLIISAALALSTDAFQSTQYNAVRSAPSSLHVTAGKGFAKIEESPIKVSKEPSKIEESPIKVSKEPSTIDPSEMECEEIKEVLLDILPRMTGKPEEFKLVQDCVNALEDKFTPFQTLDFFNLAVNGEWQFLFTTNQLGRPSPLLRLTELTQNIKTAGLKGSVSNSATWALVDDGPTFDCRGCFSSTLPYDINQGSRLSLGDDLDLKVEIEKGYNPPKDFNNLVLLLQRAMPTEMFDSRDLSLDTTYVDADIRISRFTGSKHEGVRNIFMRKGAFEINPV